MSIKNSSFYFLYNFISIYHIRLKLYGTTRFWYFSISFSASTLLKQINLVDHLYSIFAPLYFGKDRKYLIPTNTLNVQVKLNELIKKDTHYKIPETTHLRTGLGDSVVYPRATATGTDSFDYMLSLVHVINRINDY